MPFTQSTSPKRNHQLATSILIAVIAVAVIAPVALYSWRLQRKLNFNLGYKAMVQQTVRDMVKIEALR